MAAVLVKRSSKMTKFSRKMDKQLLKVSRLFKKMKKPYGEWHPSPSLRPLFICLSVTSIHLVMLDFPLVWLAAVSSNPEQS